MASLDPRNRLGPFERHAGADDSQRPILSPLKELLVDLARVGFGEKRSLPESVECWSDGDYLYLEADLSPVDYAPWILDVSIFDGRLMIRIAR